uniref:Uncharacterized protein n=1 Tax=Globodera rostochiensis TaxID=31243 RepID=A0A914HPX9_GLORO
MVLTSIFLLFSLFLLPDQLADSAIPEICPSIIKKWECTKITDCVWNPIENKCFYPGCDDIESIVQCQKQTFRGIKICIWKYWNANCVMGYCSGGGGGKCIRRMSVLRYF